jgi:hypothetical protein
VVSSCADCWLIPADLGHKVLMAYGYRVLAHKFHNDPEGVELEQELNAAAADGYRLVTATRIEAGATIIIMEGDDGNG